MWNATGTYGLAQRSALSNGNLVTLLNTESWRNVCSKILVSLLVSGVLGDEVEIFSADDESSVHFGGNHGASQDTATDGDETSEWALLVCKDGLLAFSPPCMRLIMLRCVAIMSCVIRDPRLPFSFPKF